MMLRALFQVTSAGEKKEVAKDVSIVLSDDFAVFEHSDEVIASHKVLPIDLQFHHLLPDRIVCAVHILEKGEVELLKQLLGQLSESTALSLAWPRATALLGHFFLNTILTAERRQHCGILMTMLLSSQLCRLLPPPLARRHARVVIVLHFWASIKRTGSLFFILCESQAHLAADMMSLTTAIYI